MHANSEYAMKGSRAIVSVSVDPDQIRDIDRIARQKRTSRAAIFREALDLFLAANISLADTSSADADRAVPV